MRYNWLALLMVAAYITILTVMMGLSFNEVRP